MIKMYFLAGVSLDKPSSAHLNSLAEETLLVDPGEKSGLQSDANQIAL